MSPTSFLNKLLMVITITQRGKKTVISPLHMSTVTFTMEVSVLLGTATISGGVVHTQLMA